MDCRAFQKKIPDLLLDPAAPGSASARDHASGCPACEQDYQALLSTMSMLDTWQVPEPSPYFDQKLAVLLREEQQAPRLGFFARLKDHLLFNTGRQFRPAVAGVLALVLMVGGGGYVGLQNAERNAGTAQVSAAVNDLQILDKNEAALQQMDQLLQDDDSSSGGDDAGAHAPS